MDRFTESRDLGLHFARLPTRCDTAAKSIARQPFWTAFGRRRYAALAIVGADLSRATLVEACRCWSREAMRLCDNGRPTMAKHIPYRLTARHRTGGPRNIARPDTLKYQSIFDLFRSRDPIYSLHSWQTFSAACVPRSAPSC